MIRRRLLCHSHEIIRVYSAIILLVANLCTNRVQTFYFHFHLHVSQINYLCLFFYLCAYVSVPRMGRERSLEFSKCSTNKTFVNFRQTLCVLSSSALVILTKTTRLQLFSLCERNRNVSDTVWRYIILWNEGVSMACIIFQAISSP